MPPSIVDKSELSTLEAIKQASVWSHVRCTVASIRNQTMTRKAALLRFLARHLAEIFFVSLVCLVVSIQRVLAIDTFDLSKFAIRDTPKSAALQAAWVDFATSTMLGTMLASGLSLFVLTSLDRRTLRIVVPLAVLAFATMAVQPTIALLPLQQAEIRLLPPDLRERAFIASGVYFGAIYATIVCSVSEMWNLRNAITEADARTLVAVQSRLRAILVGFSVWMICDVAQLGCGHRFALSLLDGPQKTEMYQIACASARFFGSSNSAVMCAFIVPLEMKLRVRVQDLARKLDSESPEKWANANGLGQTNYELFVKGAALLSPFVSSLIQ